MLPPTVSEADDEVGAWIYNHSRTAQAIREAAAAAAKVKVEPQASDTSTSNGRNTAPRRSPRFRTHDSNNESKIIKKEEEKGTGVATSKNGIVDPSSEHKSLGYTTPRRSPRFLVHGSNNESKIKKEEDEKSEAERDQNSPRRSPVRGEKRTAPEDESVVKTEGKRRKKCSVIKTKIAKGRKEFGCYEYPGGRKKLVFRPRCSQEGCNSYARDGELCIRHGGKRYYCNHIDPITHVGCTNVSVKGGVCYRHGAKRLRCQRCNKRVDECNKQVQAGGVCPMRTAKRIY